MMPSRRRVLFFLLAAAAAGLAVACFRARPRVGPVPANLISVEGYASWKLIRDGASARSRFTFLIVPPDRGVIEVNDPLHRTVSRLLFDGTTAYLVIPGKRAYWKADRPEIMARLLGFDLDPADLAALLSGREQELGAWELKKDTRGRIAGGRRDGLTFTVAEYFEGSGVPRTVTFDHGPEQGNLKVSQLAFNGPVPDDALRPAFLGDKRYRSVGWPEIEEWLRE